MEPQKTPYSLKSLGDAIAAEAKKEGLTIAEEAVEKLAKAAYIGLKAWGKESAILSENKVDDVILPFFDLVDQFALPQIQKIDLDGSGS